MTRALLAVALFALLTVAPAAAQDHTAFTMIRPVATGAAGTGLDGDNRVYRAYQGITYKIHADARGGEWPYTYALSNAPAGMTIDAGPCTVVGPTCTAGEITWTNPQSNATPTVTVTDRDGDTVSGTWTITVSTTACGAADGWCFIDAVSGNDTTGDGSLGNPWQTIAKVWNTVSADSNILYFRAGTYVVTGMTETTPQDCGRQVAWNENTRPVTWIGYPGETAIVNFASDGGAAVPCMELRGENIWIDNLTLRDIGSIGFQLNVRTSRYGAVIRYITGDGLNDGEDSANSAYFEWSNADTAESYYDTVQNSTFDGIQGDGIGSDSGCALKLYGVIGGVYETSRYLNALVSEAAIALKVGQQDYTVRANIFDATVRTGIGGNLDSHVGAVQTRGEIHHNNCKGSGTAFSEGCLTLGVSKTRDIGATYIYRNTWQGTINLQNVVTADGPYTFTRNVIVNSGGSASPAICNTLRATCTSITDSSRIVDSGNNLRGSASDNIIDAAGDLQGTYLTTYGPSSGTPTGHMLGASEPPAGAPTVSSISPNTGTTLGGDTVLITGTNFVGGATIAIGGVACASGGGGTSTALTCVTGARAAGVVDVVVTNPDTQTGTGTGLFTYAVAPTPTKNRALVRVGIR